MEMRAPDGLLQGVAALVGVDIIGHGPIVVVRRCCVRMREHKDAIEPHGCAQRVGQSAQHRNVALVPTHLHTKNAIIQAFRTPDSPHACAFGSLIQRCPSNPHRRVRWLP